MRFGIDIEYLDSLSSVIELPPWDGTEPLDIFQARRELELKYFKLRELPMMHAKGSDGEPLYKITSGMNFSRTKPLSPTTRRKVIERDKRCLECGNGGPFEVHHIIRYIDGGSNEMENLETLCIPCHKKKGGQ